MQWHALGESGTLESAVMLGPFPKDRPPEFASLASFLMACRLGQKFGDRVVRPVSAAAGKFAGIPDNSSHLYLFFVESPSRQKASVRFEVDDWVRIAFLNGVPFVDDPAIELRQGVNALLVDAVNDTGPGHLAVKISGAGLRQGAVSGASR
jgi:hypothetical protein